MRHQINLSLNHLFNLIFPVNCAICNSNPKNLKGLCSKCLKNLEIVYSQGCRFCGKVEKNADESNFFCQTCTGSFSYIDEIYTACHYGENIKKLIINFKYNNKRYLGKALADLLIELYLVNNIDSSDIVLWIPLTRSRFKERGYNQTKILAKYFSRNTQIKLSRQIIKRKKNTLIQAALNRKERLKNMEAAFWVVRRNKLKGKKVILIDDVATTGATLQNAAKSLKNCGAVKITALIIAHG